jgi:MFS family permease
VFGYMMNSFGFGLARSGFTAGASLAVEPEEQGRAAGLTTATAGVGFMIAPITGLWLYQTVAPARRSS